MIKQKGEIPAKIQTNLKDGIGDIAQYHFLNEAEVKGAGRLFAKTVIAPGNSIGLHTHDGDMEAYYLLKGKALVSDNGQDVILEAGDCNVCHDGDSHSIKNIGTEDLEFIAIILYSRQRL